MILAYYQDFKYLCDEKRRHVRAIAQTENALLTVARFLALFIEGHSLQSFGHAQRDAHFGGAIVPFFAKKKRKWFLTMLPALSIVESWNGLALILLWACYHYVVPPKLHEMRALCCTLYTLVRLYFRYASWLGGALFSEVAPWRFRNHRFGATTECSLMLKN